MCRSCKAAGCVWLKHPQQLLRAAGAASGLAAATAVAVAGPKLSAAAPSLLAGKGESSKWSLLGASVEDESACGCKHELHATVALLYLQLGMPADILLHASCMTG